MEDLFVMKRTARRSSVIILFAIGSLLLQAVLSAKGNAIGQSRENHITLTPTAVTVDCSAFTVTGDPRSANGATWTYQSTDQGVRYRLEGVLFVPQGIGPFPAVVISHGKGGQPNGYSANIARTMVGWGMVAIATMYTHASSSADSGNEPEGGDGASQANVLRAHKARDLLTCAGNVDLMRVAAHGHSMGAFLTGQLLGTYPADFRAASHTAGGLSLGPLATQLSAAEKIVTPYQLHHGDADIVVPLLFDQMLAGILASGGKTYELQVYPGYDHQEITSDSRMLERVHSWYQTHGMFSAILPAIHSASVSGKKLIVLGEGFKPGAVILLNGVEQGAKNDEQSPTTLLIAKKAGKKIAEGQTVMLQVRNPDGSASPTFLFTRL
jgi:dienelactone hydrolase